MRLDGSHLPRGGYRVEISIPSGYYRESDASNYGPEFYLHGNGFGAGDDGRIIVGEGGGCGDGGYYDGNGGCEALDPMPLASYDIDLWVVWNAEQELR